MRGGYGISYVHFHRAGGGQRPADQRPAGHQRGREPEQPVDPDVPDDAAGLPGRTSPIRRRFNPLLANITYMPDDYHSSRVQSYYISVQREIARNMIVDVAYVGNRADDLLLFANFNQAAPNNPQGTIPLAVAPADSGVRRHHVRVQRRQVALQRLQVKYEYRMRQGLMLLNSFTWSKAKDNGAGSLEDPNGNFPAPQDFYNLDADYGTSAYDQPVNNTTSVVWELPFGRAGAG